MNEPRRGATLNQSVVEITVLQMQARKRKTSKSTRRRRASRREENPAWLLSEDQIPGEAPRPPISTRSDLLPFLELSWENFERLCLRLSERAGKVEAAWSYGKTGHAQAGIDLLVRLTDGTFEVWQSKRRQKLSPTQIKAAVALFLRHEWASRAKRFVLAVASDFSSPKQIDAIERARDKLKATGIEFDPCDARKLTTRLRGEPDLIDDYFDRPWVTKICAPETVRQLEDRLSRFELASLRPALRDCYNSWISTIDPGLPIAGQDRQGRTRPAIPISERYVQPDIILQADRADQFRENTQRDETARRTEINKRVADAGERVRSPFETVAPDTRTLNLERRIPLDDHLAGGAPSLVVGEAGSGKSTLLRFLALDVLSDDPKLNATRDLYRGYLPIWVPFALWTRMAAHRDSPPALEDVVEAFFSAQNETALGQHMRRALRTRKIILLVDGLDEATNQNAAQTTLATLTAFIQGHRIPTIATSRPHGIRGLAGFGGNWNRVELAPLSDGQRLALAIIWFRVLEEIEGSGSTRAGELEARAQRKANIFLSALRRSPGITRLSQTPLFLLALLDLHRHGHDLPRSRFVASREIVAQLVEHQPKRRNASALLTEMTTGERRLRDRLLADFAFALQAGELYGDVPDSAFEDQAIERAARLVLERHGGGDLETAEATARAVFSFAEERAGLLVKKTSGSVGFLHLSLQEYLAACHLLKRSPDEKQSFVRQHADKVRWREPILYLLSLVDSEAEVGGLLEVIETAPCTDAHSRFLRDSLLTDAVFADFAHNVATVRRLARRFFEETEISAWGGRRRHLLSSTIDGLFSESLSGICKGKLEEWIPDHHGYGRAEAIAYIPEWDPSLRSAALPVVFRCLRSEIDNVWRQAALVLPTISSGVADVKSPLLSLLKHAPTNQTIQATLFALGRGWSADADIGRIADALCRSSHFGIALQSIRIRAMRGETDSGDLDRFLSATHDEDRFDTEIPARDLVEHFAATRPAEYAARLERAIENAGARGNRLQLDTARRRAANL